MIKTIRKYLLESDTINKYVSKDIKGAIFHEIKPKIDISNYIIIKDKPLNIGHLEEYQLDILVYGDNLQDIIRVEKALRERLNDVRGNKKVIGEDIFIRDMSMLIGGGRQYDETKDRWVSVQYFKIIL